jgi:NADP-dependent 3-hydroxy acid dehydrogenase YdfG
MALQTAKLFIQDGAYVFITGRQQDKLDEAVHLIGSNVTGVQEDASITGDLDRFYETGCEGAPWTVLPACVPKDSRRWL